MTAHFKEPLLIEKGEMQYLFDHNGKKYLDLFGGIVTVSVGHCHPKVQYLSTKVYTKDPDRVATQPRSGSLVYTI